MRIFLCSLVLALGLGTFTAYAEETKTEPTTKPAYTAGSCCDKAAKAGNECKHPCCATAAKDGKVCDHCNKKAG